MHHQDFIWKIQGNMHACTEAWQLAYLQAYNFLETRIIKMKYLGISKRINIMPSIYPIERLRWAPAYFCCYGDTKKRNHKLMKKTYKPFTPLMRKLWSKAKIYLRLTRYRQNEADSLNKQDDERGEFVMKTNQAII